MSPLNLTTLALEKKVVEPSEKTLQRLSAYALHLKNKMRRSPKTIEAYVEVSRRFILFCCLDDSGHIKNIDPEDVRSFIRESSPSLAASSQAQWSSALKSFLLWHLNLKVLNKYFESALKRPRVPKRLIQIFQEEDLPLLKNVLKDSPPDEQLLFELLYGSGLRLSEAAKLLIKHFNVEEATLRVLGKGKKWRRVPLTPVGLSLLLEKKTQSLSEEASVWSRPWGVRSLRRWVENWGKKAALEDSTGRLHPHKLRHSIASHLLRRGAQLPQIQKLLGHKKLTTTQRYTHLDVEDLVKAYDKAFPLRKK